VYLVVIFKTRALPNFLFTIKVLNSLSYFEYSHRVSKLKILCSIQRCASETHKQDMGQAKG